MLAFEIIKRVAGVIAIFVLMNNCGVGLMQSARPTPNQKTEITLGSGYIENEQVEYRGHAINNFPVNIALRYGLNEQTDVGATVWALSGLLLDAKYNLMKPEAPLALSFQVGFGGAYDFKSNQAYVLHMPVRVITSYDFLDRQITPYASIGYGAFWIFHYESLKEPSVQYAKRKGYGDGLLMVTLGLQAFAKSKVTPFMEYNLWHSVVNDPGDFYTFTTSHIFVGGMRF